MALKAPWHARLTDGVWFVWQSSGGMQISTTVNDADGKTSEYCIGTPEDWKRRK